MKEFKVFDPVLIRDHNNARWFADFYDHPYDAGEGHWCITGALVKDENILPYNEETKHLHNTVGEFVKWVPKKGEPILIKDTGGNWVIRIFLEMRGKYYACTTEHGADCTAFVWAQAKPYTNPFKE
jgi:hypothetical protein